MVEVQIAGRGVEDRHVLEAMRQVPRDCFVKPGLEEFAYEDSTLPIGEHQTISQPFIVALMIEAAEVELGNRVLEIGTGSGYAAAVLGRIAGKVYTIERYHSLGNEAQRRFSELGYSNIKVRMGDGTLGWPEAAPFDAILVAAGGPEIPQPLKDQLAIGGRLVIPVGEQERRQSLLRTDEDQFEEGDLGPVMFVPLVGERGWRDKAIRPPPARAPSLAEDIGQRPSPYRNSLITPSVPSSSGSRIGT
jgi:protein-L-isoaspartate(D-aspartate) O-methyltransferase